MKLEIKTKKELNRKVILLVGIPNGVLTGLSWYVLMKEGFAFFLEWKFLFAILFFGIIGGIILGLMWANILSRIIHQIIQR